MKMDNFKKPGVIPAPLQRRRHTMKRSLSVYSGLIPETAQNAEEVPLAESKSNRKQDAKVALVSEQPSSDDSVYMVVGPLPPADNAPNMYDSCEESMNDMAVHLCADSIRQNFMEQSRESSTRSVLFEEIISETFTSEMAFTTFENSPEMERNICMLWIVFNRRGDLLEGMVRAGADIHFCDSGGLSALHIASFVGCIKSVNYLISIGADVNMIVKCFTPLHCAAFGNHPDIIQLLIANGAIVSLTTKRIVVSNCEETILHCAVRAGAVDCLQTLVAADINVNNTEPFGVNAIHLAADLGMTRCLEILLNCKGADVNAKTKTKDKESTALHLAAAEGNIDCVDLLLQHGADAKLKNHRGFTALHLAARCSSLECVESLLRKGSADPNAEDYDKRTPLHAAIRENEAAFDVVETLIGWNANVNQKDEYGFTPLHLAALDGLSSCVETLIYHGADVTIKSKSGNTALNVITRRTPASKAMIIQKLDEAITLNTHDNREVEMELDFRSIFQNCHPREISCLNTFVDEDQKEILSHPLCSAFLYMKWEKIRKYYIARLMLCLFFVINLTLYGFFQIQWYVVATIAAFEVFRKVYGIAGYSSFRQYIFQLKNPLEWIIIFCVFFGKVADLRDVLIVLGWTNLMWMVGQLPVLASYSAMYQTVLKEFVKLLMVYSCILMGFTISFCITYSNDKEFANPLIGFISVLIMMTGEVNSDLVINENRSYAVNLIFLLFLMVVTVTLMNLLIGIAVDDIQGLRKAAGLSKLVRQTKLISYVESALFNPCTPKFLLRVLYWSALVSPTAYRVVLSVKPLNLGEKRLPRDVMMAAYEIAKLRRGQKKSHRLLSKYSKSNSFKKFKSNNYESYSETGHNNLQRKVNEANEKIDALSNEICEVKTLLKMLVSDVVKQKTDNYSTYL